MAGFQYCIFNLTGHLSWLKYLDAPTEAPAWNGTLHSVPAANCEDLITIEDIEDNLATTEVTEIKILFYDKTSQHANQDTYQKSDPNLDHY